MEEVAACARKTSRLEEALVDIAFELGGTAGARLALELGLLVARDTLLKRFKGAPLPEVGKVRVLGVDDFAFKKGSTYATILLNLENATRWSTYCQSALSGEPRGLAERASRHGRRWR